MSWQIGVILSGSVAEISARSETQKVSRRWLLIQTTFKRGLRSFFEEQAIQPNLPDQSQDSDSYVSKLTLQHSMVRRIVEKRLGNSPVVFVTSGFENWLEMSAPLHNSFFTTTPKRTELPFDRDLVFGISERTDVSGKQLRGIDESELEFLVAKLEMTGKKNVAICFLHSDKDPSNEQAVASYLKERGFNAHLSSDASEKDSSAYNERHRWWNAVLNAYISPSLEEYCSDITENIHEVCGEDCEIQPYPEQKQSELSHGKQLLDQMFSFSHLLQNLAQQTNSECMIYFGLEGFIGVRGKSNGDEQLWESPFGPVKANTYNHFELKLTPTTLVDSSFWQVPSFSEKKTGYEPGPMCFGRGLNPTLLDVLYAGPGLPNIPEVLQHCKPNSVGRIYDALRMMTPGAAASNDQEFCNQLFETALTEMALEVEEKTTGNNVICFGPFADLFVAKINQRLPRPVLSLSKDNMHLSSLLLDGNSGLRSEQ